jgi:hypothetical protein
MLAGYLICAVRRHSEASRAICSFLGISIMRLAACSHPPVDSPHDPIVAHSSH